MTEERDQAWEPNDLARLFVTRANARDADGLAALYTPDAVLVTPDGDIVRGTQQIRDAYREMVAEPPSFESVPRHATFGGFRAAIAAPCCVLVLAERTSATSSCVLAG